MLRVQDAPEGDGNAVGMTARDESGIMKSEKFTRRSPRDNDVVLQITYCGMCHSDVHQLRGEWGGSQYPMIPGHEIIGVVIDTGDKVTKFKVGDSAAVGCMVDSCLSCNHCKNGDEQYCREGMVGTYNSKCAVDSSELTLPVLTAACVNRMNVQLPYACGCLGCDLALRVSVYSHVLRSKMQQVSSSFSTSHWDGDACACT